MLCRNTDSAGRCTPQQLESGTDDNCSRPTAGESVTSERRAFVTDAVSLVFLLYNNGDGDGVDGAWNAFAICRDKTFVLRGCLHSERERVRGERRGRETKQTRMCI